MALATTGRGGHRRAVDFQNRPRRDLTFRFVHTADLHLDSPLVALSLRDPDLAESLGVATRTALSRIVDLCIDEGVHALLIAGDLWDGSQTSAKTPGFLKQELMRLDQAGIRCFIIRGNHDAISKVTKELEVPPNTVIFGRRAATHTFTAGGHDIAVHGLSFHDAQAPTSLLPQYPAAKPGAFNIGMMHTSLNGSEGHDIYAPCRVADLDGFGYDYWALGHIHRRAVHHGQALVVMPGIPQGRDIGEAGAASVTLGTLDDDGNLTVQERSVASLRFDRLQVDMDGVSDWSEVVAAMDRTLRDEARKPRPEAHLVLRPRLTGATPMAWRIARDLDRLTEEAQASAGALGGIWIDKLENATTGPEGQANDQLPADLSRIVMQDLPGDPGLTAAVLQAARDLQRDLPPDLRDLLGEDEAGFHATCAELLAQGSTRILSRLTREDE